MEPHAYLAYVPNGVGVASALFYLVHKTNVYGWYIGADAYAYPPAFFALEDFYSTRATVFCRSVEDDAYGPWVQDSAPVTTDIRCPVPEPICHELDRCQAAFVREWLFFPEDARNVAEYRRLGLPVEAVNIRADQFHRFARDQPVWTYTSPGTDLNMISYLKRSWPLDDKEVETAFAMGAEAPQRQ
jgi:hypothetical protein